MKMEQKSLVLKVNEKSNNCAICYEKEVNSVFYDCGHMACCLECGKAIFRNNGICPVCRKKIKDVLKTYKS